MSGCNRDVCFSFLLTSCQSSRCPQGKSTRGGCSFPPCSFVVHLFTWRDFHKSRILFLMICPPAYPLSSPPVPVIQEVFATFFSAPITPVDIKLTIFPR